MTKTKDDIKFEIRELERTIFFLSNQSKNSLTPEAKKEADDLINRCNQQVLDLNQFLDK